MGARRAGDVIPARHGIMEWWSKNIYGIEQPLQGCNCFDIYTHGDAAGYDEFAFQAIIYTI